mmetsp:Transcript_37742/g.94891  ORF Transcript_37742/g.94891 Transcript_37742/m.94891 type:complete len:480 (+) Transcript_37742:719-2158(+)
MHIGHLNDGHLLSGTEHPPDARVLHHNRSNHHNSTDKLKPHGEHAHRIARALQVEEGGDILQKATDKDDRREEHTAVVHHRSLVIDDDANGAQHREGGRYAHHGHHGDVACRRRVHVHVVVVEGTVDHGHGGQMPHHTLHLIDRETAVGAFGHHRIAVLIEGALDRRTTEDHLLAGVSARRVEQLGLALLHHGLDLERHTIAHRCEGHRTGRSARIERTVAHHGAGVEHLLHQCVIDREPVEGGRAEHSGSDQHTKVGREAERVGRSGAERGHDFVGHRRAGQRENHVTAAGQQLMCGLLMQTWIHPIEEIDGIGVGFRYSVTSTDVDRIQSGDHQRDLNSADHTDTMSLAHETGQVAAEIVRFVESGVHRNVVVRLRGGGWILHERDLRILLRQCLGSHLESRAGREDHRVAFGDQLFEGLAAHLQVELGHGRLDRGQKRRRVSRCNTVTSEFMFIRPEMSEISVVDKTCFETSVLCT